MHTKMLRCVQNITETETTFSGIHAISGKFPFCQFCAISGNFLAKISGKILPKFLSEATAVKKFWEVAQKIFWLFTKNFRKFQNTFSKKRKVLLQKGETFLENLYRIKVPNFHEGRGMTFPEVS